VQGVFKFGERKKNDNHKIDQVEEEAGAAPILEDELENLLEDDKVAAAGPARPLWK